MDPQRKSIATRRFLPMARARRRPNVATPVTVRNDSADPSMHGPFTTDAVINGYRIVGCIGVAGMSKVYLAYHEHTSEAVAIKVVHEYLLISPRHQASFDYEIACLQRFAHPNLQTFVTAGETCGRRYLVTTYVPGEHVHRFLMRRGTFLTSGECADLALQVVSALIEARRLKIVHRDVKMENLLARVDADGRLHVTLIDWGLARPSSSNEHVGMSGTPILVPPQQAQGCVPDERDDQFSLALAMYEALTGVHPAKGTGVDLNVDESYLHALREYAVYFSPLNERNASVPPALANAIMRMLSLSRENRFPNWEAVAKALLPFVPDDRRSRVALYRRRLHAVNGLVALSLQLRRARWQRRQLGARTPTGLPLT